jgi:hypothetical protein
MAFSETVASAYVACLKAIPTIRRLDDVKEFRDMAMGLVQAARQRKNLVAERQCVEIRIRCERRWGELYRVSDKAKGTRGQLVSRGVIGARKGRQPATPALADMGVSHAQSARWQALAHLSDDEFELALSRRLGRCGGQPHALNFMA